MTRSAPTRIAPTSIAPTILVVDDSLTVRMDLTDATIAAGLDAVPCATLAAARDALRDRSIGLVLLDVRLPDGDGIDLLRELRADPATVALPVLVLSSEAEVADRIRGLAIGATDYIGKPYDIGQVISRIRQLVATERREVVLVIDDSPTFRAELSAQLAAAGYDTIAAADGFEGLRLAAARQPTAIIVDGVLPGMDGTTVIRRIRLDPNLRTIPCLLLTGATDRAAEVDALEAGADAFVRKEDDAEVILARLGAMLRSAHRTRTEVASVAGHHRILAVDDSPTYLHTLADQLRRDGFDVVLASSGEQAIDLLAVQPVDCILLDRMMPGMSGAETCHRIKAAPRIRDTPLIMVTALEGRDAMIDGLTAGADDFISKSSGVDVLKARVQAQIRRKQIEAEHRDVRERLLTIELEARAARELAETRAAMTEELERANAQLDATNRELEAFSYSISHDLRAPLRAVGGFSAALVEALGDKLDDTSRELVDRVLSATRRMEGLIDDLIELANITRAELVPRRVDLSAVCRQVVEELRRADPERRVDVTIEPGMSAYGDLRLLRGVFDHLLGNAWKFTKRTAAARIEIGTDPHAGERVYFVRDNGAGFDGAHADHLFMPFKRMHPTQEFGGRGIGLAIVRRILERHGGRIWADAAPDHGATLYFTVAGPS